MIYAQMATQMHDVNASRLAHASHFQQVRNGLAVSQFGCTVLIIFVEPKAGSATETYRWCRSFCRQPAALLGKCLPSSKTLYQHIVLVTQSNFCAVRDLFYQASGGQPTLPT